MKKKHFSEQDEKYMRQALGLANGGIGLVNPNPLVGAVIVNELFGKVLGRGFHKRFGHLHAERNAINDCIAQGNNPEDATMYVTLMPCCHKGKQPPCTDAIIDAGIRKVIVGSSDPNPLVGKKSMTVLQKNGILIRSGCLKAECDEINKVFFHYITKKRPYVVMKYAMSADGRIACSNGASRWISNKQARKNSHELRNRYSAIMVGVGTILADNPQLNCRKPNGRDPVRIICDTHLKTPLNSNVVKSAGEQPTIIAYGKIDSALSDSPKTRILKARTSKTHMSKALSSLLDKKGKLEAQGCICVEVPLISSGQINLNALMKMLGQCEIDSILLEGGAALNASALKAQIVQEANIYIGNKILGGADALGPIGGTSVKHPDKAYGLRGVRYEQLGENLLLKADIDYSKCKKRKKKK